MVQLAQGHVAVNFNFSLLHRAAQKGGPLVIRHALHLAAGIVRQMLTRIGVGCAGTGHFHHGGQADVRTGRAAPQLIAAAFHFPAVGPGVPVAECLVVQRDGHGLAFAGLQLHLGKAFQLLCGAEHFCPGFCHIQLHDLCSGALAGVGYGQGHAIGRGLQIAVGKTGVA